MKHNREHCKRCFKSRGKKCIAFKDPENPILDDDGYCLGRMTDEDEYKKLMVETKSK